MKFKEHSSSAVKVGDIQSNTVSIDANNLDFIITILSSGLYSKPIESFVREIVSNAWDAHVEAGNTEEPVVLELGQTTEGRRFCRIQDFGVGLSPERFNKIYRNIGSSTKRGTNDQIGGFGIGRFSALSYSNVVKITSYHDGTEYMYLMCKENNKLTIDLLYSKPTTNSNGVAVEIDINTYDTQNFVDAIQSQLAYFNNLVVLENIQGKPYGIEKKFNEFKIKNYKHFCCNTLNSYSPSILLGKVNYPLRFSGLRKSYSSKVMNSYPIAIKLEIGDVEITPNREELLYTPEGIQKIEDALDASIKEIDNLILAQNNKDYQDINEFIEAVEGEDELVLVSDKNNVVEITSFSPSRKKMFKGVNYNCEAFSSHFKAVRSFRNTKGYHTIGSNRTINFKQYGLYLYAIQNCIGISKVYVSDVAKLNAHAKAYIRETYASGTIFINAFKFKSSTKKLINTVKDSFKRNKDQYDSEIMKLVLNYWVAEYKKIPVFDNSSVPKQFIDDRKDAARARRKSSNKEANYWKQNISLQHINVWSSNDANNYKLSDLNTAFKKLTVYSYKGDERLNDIARAFNSSKVHFVGVAPTKMKLLADLSNFVNLENFMDKKYKAIRNLGTVMRLKKEFPELNALANDDMLPLISTSLTNVVKELYNFCRNAKGQYASQDIESEIYDYCVNENAFNDEILGLYKANEKELKSLKILTLIDASTQVQGYGNVSKKLDLTNFVVDYILARKLFRPDVDAVKKLRKETIFNNK